MDELLSRQCGLHSYEGVSVNASFHGISLHSEFGAIDISCFAMRRDDRF